MADHAIAAFGKLRRVAKPLDSIINDNHMKKIPVLILLAQFFLAIHALNAQGLTSDQIDSIVNKSMEMMPQVGIALAVVQDRKVVHSKGYGITSITSKKEVDENTLFSSTAGL